MTNTKQSNLKQRNIKTKTWIKYFSEFSENTSLHGLKYVGQPNTSTAERIWWIIAFTLGCIICCFLVFKVWTKWEQTPVVVTLGNTETSIGKIPFPAITVCSSDKLLKSTYDFDKECGKLNSINETELFKLQSVALVCGPYGIAEQVRIGKNVIFQTHSRAYNFTNESSTDILKEVMLRKSDVLYNCENEMNNCLDNFKPILTSQGNCFTYNMININEIFREDVANINYASEIVPNDGWTLEEGYPKNSNKNAYPFRGKGSGFNNGIHFVLKKSRLKDYYVSSEKKIGFKIAFHPPDSLPPIDDDFSWIPLKVDSIISIEPQMVSITESLRSYDYKKRMCFYSNEKILKFFKVYSKENCEMECLTNYTMAQCQCVAYYMPHSPNTPICSTRKYECVKSAKLQLFSINNEEINCNCLPACTALKYKKSVTYVPDNDVIHCNVTLSWCKDVPDKTSVSVYFDSAYFIISQRSELYGLIDFLANCGGLMGVCLGFSILSLVEIIYFITLRCYFKFGRNQNNISTID